jgi:hypothetical protein
MSFLVKRTAARTDFAGAAHDHGAVTSTSSNSAMALKFITPALAWPESGMNQHRAANDSLRQFFVLHLMHPGHPVDRVECLNHPKYGVRFRRQAEDRMNRIYRMGSMFGRLAHGLSF